MHPIPLIERVFKEYSHALEKNAFFKYAFKYVISLNELFSRLIKAI